MRAAVFGAILALATADGGAAGSEPLPDLGPAPGFDLVATDGSDISLADLRGKVVAVSFLYTWCPDICPLHTMRMAETRDALGEAFGRDVAFVSITFDPVRDTPEVLGDYASQFDADPKTWRFLTGDPEVVQEVVRAYGVLTFPGEAGSIDHNLLTTLIDRDGRMRVQYTGFRFDPDEMRRDLLALATEPR